MTEEDVDLTPDYDAMESGLDAIDGIEATLERFLDTAGVDQAFGEPVEHGDVTIIPAAEVLVGLGFGMGFGSGTSPNKETQETNSGSGGGGGGGGRILSRPVAVIVAGPDGVRVEPVLDPTKIALAAFTAGGFMMSMIARMLRGPRRG